MKNFIFKSTADFHKILFNQLRTVLDEQRHQRMDLALIIRFLKRPERNANLQKQVDEYFKEDDEETSEHIPEE